jgi:hypothetical protein
MLYGGKTEKRENTMERTTRLILNAIELNLMIKSNLSGAGCFEKCESGTRDRNFIVRSR